MKMIYIANILLKCTSKLQGFMHARNVHMYILSKHYSRETGIRKSVFISQSHDIYTNLAMEDWLYKNLDMSQHHVLLLWHNDPCVVIGRHQNPWLEANISYLEERNIKLARRNSGGGTVYHDRGNLNMTFCTAREHYDRVYNLELIRRALSHQFGIQVERSPRHDLICGDRKISGSAAKLGRANAYHHCTLLVNANKAELGRVFQKHQTTIDCTNATRSTSSTVMNLCDIDPNITMDSLMAAVGWEYLKTNPAGNGSERAWLINSQRGFQLINPTDQWFPGLTEIQDKLASWEWCYGSTPKFSASRAFTIPANLLKGISVSDHDHSQMCDQQLKVTVNVFRGRVEEVLVDVPSVFTVDRNLITHIRLMSSLKGCKFTEEAISNLKFSIGATDNILSADHFVTECVRQVMNSV